MDIHLNSLIEKLAMLTTQDEIELNPFEAEIYGIANSDILPLEEYQGGPEDG